jgi:ABC-type branched-subunit amino acid transport system substrate-binding protein
MQINTLMNRIRKGQQLGVRLFFSLSLVFLTAAQCDERPEPIQSVKVGVLVPQTGTLAGLGASWSRAAQLAAEQINSAGGLFEGRPLELVVMDTETSIGPSIAAAQEVLNDGVVAIVGPATSGNVEATQELIAAESVPQVSCCATSVPLTENQDNETGWFFRTAPNDKLQSKALAYMAANGLYGPHPKFAGSGDGETVHSCPELLILHQDDNYGTPLKDSLSAEYQGRAILDHDDDGNVVEVIDPNTSLPATGRVIAEQNYARAFTDEKTQEERRVAAGEIVAPLFEAFRDNSGGHDVGWNPRVCVAMISYGSDGAALLEALLNGFNLYDADLGISTTVNYYGSDGLTDSGFTTNGGSNTSQVVVISPTHAENEAYEKFSNAFSTRYSEAAGPFTSQMFDATMLIGLAITNRSSEDGEEIRDALFDISSEGQRFDGKFFGEMADALLDGSDIDYVGPSGELDFSASGDVIGDYALLRGALVNTAYSLVETDFLPSEDFNN